MPTDAAHAQADSIRPTPLVISEMRAARLLAVCYRTLARWRKAGVGPRYSRVGIGRGRIVYRVVDLEAFLERCVDRSEEQT